LYEILTDDAYLIWELASVLLDRMDDDLMEVYFFGELKIALILRRLMRQSSSSNFHVRAYCLEQGTARRRFRPYLPGLFGG
jgi:hypothetical protein